MVLDRSEERSPQSLITSQSLLFTSHNMLLSQSLLSKIISLSFTIMFLPPPSPLSTQVDGTIWFKAPVGLGISEQRRLW